MSDYDEDFENSSVERYSEESFEAFESDGDSMLLLGNPIDHIIKLAEMGASDMDNGDYSNEDFFGNFDALGTFDEAGFDYGAFADYEEASQNPKVNVTFNSQESLNQYEENPRQHSFVEVAQYESKKLKGKGKGKSRSKTNNPTHTYSIKSENVKIRPAEGEVMMGKLATSINSNISRETKYSVVVLKKQLELAVKRINAYRKERVTLLDRLDSSSVEAEFEKLRNKIMDQEEKIDVLTGENRAMKVG